MRGVLTPDRPERLRVVMLINRLNHGGGAERAMVALAKHLRKIDSRSWSRRPGATTARCSTYEIANVAAEFGELYDRLVAQAKVRRSPRTRAHDNGPV